VQLKCIVALLIHQRYEKRVGELGHLLFFGVTFEEAVLRRGSRLPFSSLGMDEVLALLSPRKIESKQTSLPVVLNPEEILRRTVWY